MKRANVLMHGVQAGILQEINKGKSYIFSYLDKYNGSPVSLTMPTDQKDYLFDVFPPFFDGLLPEGIQLESMLRINKIDRNDYFSQLVSVGADLIGAVTVEEA